MGRALAPLRPPQLSSRRCLLYGALSCIGRYHVASQCTLLAIERNLTNVHISGLFLWKLISINHGRNDILSLNKCWPMIYENLSAFNSLSMMLHFLYTVVRMLLTVLNHPNREWSSWHFESNIAS